MSMGEETKTEEWTFSSWTSAKASLYTLFDSFQLEVLCFDSELSQIHEVTCGIVLFEPVARVKASPWRATFLGIFSRVSLLLCCIECSTALWVQRSCFV